MTSYQIGRKRHPDLGFPLNYLARTGERPMPAVVYLHGFAGSRDSHFDTRTGIADVGYLVVSFDAPMHGERGRLAVLWNSCRRRFLETFVGVLAAASEDVKAVIKVLREDPLVDSDRIAVVGCSMGAMVCLMAVPRLEGIKAAVAMAGTADYLAWIGQTSGQQVYEFRKGRTTRNLRALLEEYDPIHRAADFYPTPLLLVGGAKDELVPPTGPSALHALLQPHYAQNPSALRLSVYPELGHETSNELLEEVHQWLLEHV